MTAPGAAMASVWDEVDGTRIHGRVSALAGVATGPPIVFVHGLGVSTRYMEPTMVILGREHQVVGLDMPGFGRSAGIGYHCTVPQLADAVLHWLDARGIGPAVFVANSFGCQVVTEIVSREPQRALGIVLNAPTMDRAHRSVLAMIARVFVDARREPLALALIVTRDYLRAGPYRIIATLVSALADRIEDKLPRVTIPVSVVCGARDPLVSVAWGEEVARLVGRDCPDAPGATLHVVPHIAHALPFDDPETFAAIIADLLGRVMRALPTAPRHG